MKAAILAALAALVLAGAAGSQARQPPQQPRSEQPEAADNRGTVEQPLIVDIVPAQPNEPQRIEDERERKRQANADDRMFWVNALLATIACLQVCVGALALRGVHHARRSADAAEKNIETIQNTAKAQSRAYVGVVSCQIIQMDANSKLRARVVYKNTGQTPAREARAWATIGHWGRDQEVILKGAEPKSDWSVFTLGAGAESGTEPQVPFDLSPEHFAEIKNRQRLIYVWGAITYLDVFKERHTTTFCFVTGGDGDRALRADRMMVRAGEGNEED